jgi:hypothetical protein
MAVLLFNAAASQTLSYESVRLDDSGQLHIKPVNGKEAMGSKATPPIPVRGTCNFTRSHFSWVACRVRRGGRAVAYSTGSRHGGANECLLADIKSGKVLEKWPTPTRGRLPLWAEQLRR